TRVQSCALPILIRIGDVQVIESGNGGLDAVDDVIDFGGQSDNVFPVERGHEDLIQVRVNLAGDLIALLFQIVEFLNVSGWIQVSVHGLPENEGGLICVFGALDQQIKQFRSFLF